MPPLAPLPSGLLDLVREPRAYFDSLQARIRPALNAEERQRMEAAGAKRKKWDKVSGYLGRRYDAHGPDPTQATLEVLRELARSHLVLLQRIDLAVDWVVGDEREAERLLRFLDAHVVQRHHGKDDVRYHRGTRYTRPRRWRSRNLVLYAGPHAARKHGGRPAVHLEMRLTSAATVAHAVGPSPCSPIDLLRFDHAAFWRRTLLLEEPRLRTLGRQFRGRGRENKPDLATYAPSIVIDRDLRAGEALVRACSRENRTAQDVRDAYQRYAWFRPERALARFDTGPLLAGLPSVVVTRHVSPLPTPRG